MSFVLDTDHCVEILRNRLDVTPYVTADEPLYVTAIGVSELAYGAHKSSRPAQHLAALEQFLRAVTVLPFDEHAAGRYGALKANLERQGQVIGELDLQIAAVTLTHGLRLVTHNQAHFVRIPDLALDDWLAQKTS